MNVVSHAGSHLYVLLDSPSQMIFQYDSLIDEELQIFTLNSLFCRNFSLLATN